MSLSILTFIIILFLIILAYLYHDQTYGSYKNPEYFQYIFRGNKRNPPTAIDYLEVDDENKLLITPSTSTAECTELCRTTPDCNGFNYALQQCTLYKDIEYTRPENVFYRSW